MKAFAMTRLRRFALAAATALVSTTASAAVVNFSGTLLGTDPLFNRPREGSPPALLGSSVYHDVYAFFVTVGDTYTLQTTSASLDTGGGSNSDDTFIVLYQNSFNRLSPLTNALEADDEDGAGSLSSITRALAADTQYFLVVTTFSGLTTGDYTGTISNDGDGTAVLGTLPPPNVVPLPGTLALAALGLAGMAASRRKRAA